MRRAAILTLCLSACASGPDFAFDPDAEEGVHADVDIEWWYHFGWLTDEDGNEWAHFSSFFRTRRAGVPMARYLIHDLTDLKTGKKHFRSRAGAETLEALKRLTGMTQFPAPHETIRGPLLEKAGDPLRLRYDDAEFEKTGHRRYRLKVGDVDLRLRAVSDPMAVEGTGLTGVLTPDDMHYYTIPRLEAAGTVRGRKVRGTLWYDHQWGASWVGPDMGWSWWGLQLDDGTNVNAYVLRNPKTGHVHKATFTRDSRLHPLKATPTRRWTGRSGTKYPIAWDLEGDGLKLRVEPMFDDREVPILGSLRAIWEGPVRVTGDITGRGYQELVGYATVSSTR